MTKEELERKSETEGLTAEEVTEYQRIVKPVRHVYGKYGTMKKKYVEEHDWVKTAALGKDLPEYLHAIDRAADDLYEIMYEKLKKDERFRRTGNFIEDVKRENAVKSIIEEEILSELIYGEAEL